MGKNDPRQSRPYDGRPRKNNNSRRAGIGPGPAYRPTSTGAGSGHRGKTRSGAGTPPPDSGCGGKKSIVAMPFILLAVVFYGLPRLAYDTWKERRCESSR